MLPQSAFAGILSSGLYQASSAHFRTGNIFLHTFSIFLPTSILTFPEKALTSTYFYCIYFSRSAPMENLVFPDFCWCPMQGLPPLNPRHIHVVFLRPCKIPKQGAAMGSNSTLWEALSIHSSIDPKNLALNIAPTEAQL